MIKIRIVLPNYDEINVKIEDGDDLLISMKEYIKDGQVVIFDGRIIREDDTPTKLNMKKRKINIIDIIRNIS